ncbi:hypothetical protein HAZT_HAZT000581 [Hyalella azteca]|nr:hypothetical protein HAZT_HAZT000581 [Hyalella azteca]
MLVVTLFSAQTRAQFDLCFTDSAAAGVPSNEFNFTGVDNFGLGLIRELNEHLTATQKAGDVNLLVSPYSVWSALSLALMGAQGTTLKQLQDALGLPNTKLGAYRTKYALDFVLRALGSGANGSPELRRVDRAYFDPSVNLRPCVSDVIHDVQTLNMLADPAPACLTMPPLFAPPRLRVSPCLLSLHRRISLVFRHQKPDLDQTLAKLSPYTLGQALAAMKPLQVNVSIPKFDLEVKLEDELVQSLKQLGITDMFDRTRSNFSSFTADSGPLFVDEAIHKAKVRVDESGTVAAAATALMATRSGANSAIQFVANRPFLFLIYDSRVRVTLFAGIIRNPTK